MHHRMPPSKTVWPILNVVIFPPVLRLSCKVQNSDNPGDYTRLQDFGTWKVYCVCNVTFHAEFKYAIRIFPSPTVFVQWHFLLSIFRNFRYFLQWFFIREPIFWMVLNRGWSQTIYHYQITSWMCSETLSEWNRRWFMALGVSWR